MAFDFDAAVTAPFRMQPGLRRMAPGAWHLTPTRPGSRHLLEKLAVLSAHANQALLAQPGFDARPALDALVVCACAEHPQAVFIDADGRFHARRLGWSIRGGEARGEGSLVPEVGTCLGALPAEQRLNALLALAFCEDFAVLDAATGTLPWLAVALPSRWAPESKLGRSFLDVHSPVADNRLILSAAQPLMSMVTGGEHWERFVWTITHEPKLDAHPARSHPSPWQPDADAEELAAQAWWRTEHQTFIPVPGRAQAVFTILVDTKPLTDAIDTPDKSRRLHAALASMSPEVLAYRSLATARDRLLQWLESRSA